MTVLKGEGRVPILFGSTSVAVASRVHGGYLARPDLSGQWPTVLVVASARGVSSSVKDVCRRLARQGFATIAPDLYDGRRPSPSTSDDDALAAFAQLPAGRVDRDLADFVAFITNPAGFWSSAEHGLGVLGIGNGGSAAIRTAGRHDAVALALAYVAVDVDDATRLGSFTGGLLGMYGRADEVVPVDMVEQVRSAAPHAEMVVYAAAGHDFLDDHSDGYDRETAVDAIERLTGFFEKRLPPAPA